MRAVLNRLNGVLRGTARDVKPSEKERFEKETARSSTTSGTIEPEVWIMSGLLLSLVVQIGGASLLPKLGAKPEIHTHKEPKVPLQGKQ